MNKYSEIYLAFVETYGEMGQNYDEDTWMERLGVFVCGWLACEESAQQGGSSRPVEAAQANEDQSPAA